MKFAAALLASCALACAGPTALRAQTAPVQADTIDLSAHTQLPRTAIPHHYALTVTPHADRLTFDGTVSIDLEVVKPTRELVLNAADLKFASASLQSAAGSAVRGQVSLDSNTQTATIAFPRVLTSGSYRLTLVYSGKINTQANGLFALDYKNKEGKDDWSLNKRIHLREDMISLRCSSDVNVRPLSRLVSRYANGLSAFPFVCGRRGLQAHG